MWGGADAVSLPCPRHASRPTALAMRGRWRSTSWWQRGWCAASARSRPPTSCHLPAAALRLASRSRSTSKVRSHTPTSFRQGQSHGLTRARSPVYQDAGRAVTLVQQRAPLRQVRAPVFTHTARIGRQYSHVRATGRGGGVCGRAGGVGTGGRCAPCGGGRGRRRWPAARPCTRRVRLVAFSLTTTTTVLTMFARMCTEAACRVYTPPRCRRTPRRALLL
jgi:hypothetical protein